MKLSKREFTLVAVLGLVLGSIGYYKYIIVPQTAIAASASVERAQKRNELVNFKTDIASNHKLKVELMKLQKKLNSESESYFLTLDQEEIILLLSDFAKETNVKVEAINFEEPRVEILEEEEGDEKSVSVDSSEEMKEKKEVKKEEKEKKEDSSETKVTVEGDLEEDESDNLDVYTADLEYESSYASLLELLKLITSHDKRIMIKDININKEETENQNIKGNISLDFYVIGKILGEEDSIYAWGATSGSILADPFSQFIGYYKPKEEDNSDSEETADEDNDDSLLSANVSGAKNTEKIEDKSSSNNLNISSELNISGNSSSSVKDTGLGSNGNNTKPGNTGSTGESGGSQNGNVSKPNKPINPEKPEDKPKEIIKELFTFEDMSLLSFGSTINEDIIKGEMILNKEKKIQGESSLNLKYDFVEKRRYNQAEVSFTNGLEITEQPKRLSLSVYPIEKNNCSLGVIVKDREGEEYRLPLTNNLDWDGWQTLSVALPIDINYPATVKSVYIESRGRYVKLTGDLLMDDLKLIYLNE